MPILQFNEIEVTTVDSETTCVLVPSKIARRPSVASKVLPTNSEKLG